jgi:hypothetical protein
MTDSRAIELRAARERRCARVTYAKKQFEQFVATADLTDAAEVRTHRKLLPDIRAHFPDHVSR